MLFQKKNDLGVINIDDSFLIQLEKDAISVFKGKVFLANYKGKQQDFLIKLGNFDSLAEYKFDYTEKGLLLDVYLIINFGTSIESVCKHVSAYMAKILSNNLGIEIDDINIHITAIITSKAIIQKNILYSLKNGAED